VCHGISEFNDINEAVNQIFCGGEIYYKLLLKMWMIFYVGKTGPWEQAWKFVQNQATKLSKAEIGRLYSANHITTAPHPFLLTTILHV
jgi:hypothetical protein